MAPIVWTEVVDLQRRGLSPADGTVEIDKLASGPLSEMVDRVFQMPAPERGDVWIDGEAIGVIGVFEILALSMRADFPR